LRQVAILHLGVEDIRGTLASPMQKMAWRPAQPVRISIMFHCSPRVL
jgi:hypothetical protein